MRPIIQHVHPCACAVLLYPSPNPTPQDAEFDLACSQDWGEGDRPQKRKVSVANRSIMV